MDISYDHYRTFYYVAKHKSFTRAAEMLYSNQPNVTRSIKLLEQALGCVLFERTNKGARLTSDGEALFEHIAVAFEHIQAGEEVVALKRSLQNGLVSLGASEIALRCYLLPILAAYHRQYPGVRIKILNVSTPQALKMLGSGLVDLAIVTTPLDTQDRFCETRLHEFREVPVCGRAFAEKLGDEQPCSMSCLAEYPIISLGYGTSTYEYYARLFSQRGIRFAPDIEAATADQILPLVAHNLGIGFVPEAFLEDAVCDTVHTIALKEPIPPRCITLVRSRDRSLPLPAKELVRMIQKK